MGLHVADAARHVAGASGRARILEVGAGTGLATRAALAALQPLAARFDYVCTDRSPALLEAARARLGNDLPISGAAIIRGDPADE